MQTDPKPTNAARLRLIADRLCYLSEGMDGLRTRHGLLRAYGNAYRDRYDVLAAAKIDHVPHTAEREAAT